MKRLTLSHVFYGWQVHILGWATRCASAILFAYQERRDSHLHDRHNDLNVLRKYATFGLKITDRTYD